jgi:hypothetical protein
MVGKKKGNVMHFIKMIAGFSMVFSLCACSSMRNQTMPDEDNLLSGAGAMMSEGKDNTDVKADATSFEQLNLTKLLKDYGFSDPTNSDLTKEGNDSRYQYLRNELQDRIIAASNQRCSTYIRTLISSKAQTKMGWAGLATLLSGAASVVNPAQLARVLSAGSTVSNGILSTYNEAYFNDLAITAISTGIMRKRQALLEQLTEDRKSKKLVDYPVNRAISDALTYHAACNLISGLQVAVSATITATNKELLVQK